MEFPKHVYRRGTGKKVEGKADCFTAESALVQSEVQLSALEGEWCDSPVDAVAVQAAEPPPKVEIFKKGK